jgi:DNA polymerase I-like protein with 3'-5' exonuclease and polymerase domains
MLLAIDIETAPADEFKDYEDAALDFHRNKITQIAWAAEDGRAGCFQTVSDLNNLLAERSDWEFIGHNFKFDLKTLIEKGAHLTFDSYCHDTMLQAVANYDKTPESWLTEYNVKRAQKNTELGKNVHRNAGQYSLKTLAPYHLGIEPFWEVDGHDDAEYATKDALYTLQLFKKQREILRHQGTEKFYTEKLMPWARMILEAEYTGIQLDLEKMKSKWAEADQKAKEAQNRLVDLWQEPILYYEKIQRQKIEKQYEGMKSAAILKAKTDKTKASAEIRYEALKEKALEKVEPFNMASPSQLMWLLRDYLQLDVTNLDGEDSTGKEVLKRLAEEGREDIKAFLDFRRYTKLSTAFFPSYNSMHWNGILHCNFNLNGTRTGRLSSSGPNLQQVPGDLHDLFIARPGYKLICYDLANIEPLLIAYASECPNLTALMIAGESFHDSNVKLFFDVPEETPLSEIKAKYPRERKVAKEIGLACLYGAGPKRIRASAMKYGFNLSESEVKRNYEKFKTYYKAIYDYKKELDKRLENGEAVKNLLGRQYTIPVKQDVYLKGFNTYIQSSASDLLIEGARRTRTELKQKDLDARPLLLVHDELVVEALEDQAPDVEKIIVKNILGFTLRTQLGEIKLKAEGGIHNHWSK